MTILGVVDPSEGVPDALGGPQGGQRAPPTPPRGDMGITIANLKTLMDLDGGPQVDATAPEAPWCTARWVPELLEGGQGPPGPPQELLGRRQGPGSGPCSTTSTPAPHPTAPYDVAFVFENQGRTNATGGGQSLACPEVTVPPWRRRASSPPPGEVPTRTFSPRGDALPGGAASRRSASAAHDVDGSTSPPQGPAQLVKQGVLGRHRGLLRADRPGRTPPAGPRRPIETVQTTCAGVFGPPRRGPGG